ncbi:MAG: M28 family peptidase, partial [Gemmatimonadetes bacterium]|nr:M28 family peptidase [Gemmatimonadota bacterium]
MRNRRGIRWAVFVSLALAGIGGGCEAQAAGSDQDTRASLLRDLQALAGDEMEGRGLGQPGLERALDYAAGALQRARTEPGYRPREGSPTFLHPVPLVRYEYGGGIRAVIRQRGRRWEAGHGDDLVLLAPGSRVRDVPPAPPVFVGYGVSEPERGWDDYEGLDVRGRLLIMYESWYPTLPAELQAEYADPAVGGVRRARAAEAHGAAGIIVIPHPAVFRQWDLIVGSRREGTFVAARDYAVQAPMDSPFPVVALSRTALEALFADSGFDPLTPETDYRRFSLEGVEVALELDVTRSPHTSHNAVGMVPGTDPGLAGEVIVVSAHIDHLGMVAGEIFNGANDDASGSVQVLELARRFARNPAPRSVLFTLFTAEEWDHLGSIHLLEEFPVPGVEVVGSVNLEHMGRSGDGTLLATADGTLLPLVEAVASGRGQGRLRAQPLETPRVIMGSDSYSFLQHRIPFVIIGGGTFPEYHTPGDDVDLIDLDLLTDGVELVEELVRRMAGELVAVGAGPGVTA